MWLEDGEAKLVEHWTANLAARVRSPVGEEPSVLMCAFRHVQMESNRAGLSVCNCRHTGKWCGTIKAVGNTDHTKADMNTHADTTIPSRRMRSGGWRDEWQRPDSPLVKLYLHNQPGVAYLLLLGHHPYRNSGFLGTWLSTKILLCHCASVLLFYIQVCWLIVVKHDIQRYFSYIVTDYI